MKPAPYGVKNLRLTAALWTLLIVVAAADWFGWGHRYLGIALLAGFFYLARWLPERGWRWLIGALLWFSVAVAVEAVAQMWFMDRARGPFASPNFLGYYAVLYLFLAVGGVSGGGLPRQWRDSVRFRAAVATANLLSLALSQSRGAILALGAGCVAMLWWRRPVAATLILCSSILAVLTIRPGLEEARLGIWKIGWQAVVQRPLLGYGQGGIWIGGLGAFYSVPLDLMLAAGFLGLMAGAWLFIEGWRACVRPRRFLDAHDAARPSVQLDPSVHERMTQLDISGHAIRGFLAAWLVGGLFIFGTPATLVPFFLVLGRLSRKRGGRTPTACGPPAFVGLPFEQPAPPSF